MSARYFYSWNVVGATLVMPFFSFGLGFYGLSVYVATLQLLLVWAPASAVVYARCALFGLGVENLTTLLGIIVAVEWPRERFSALVQHRAQASFQGVVTRVHVSCFAYHRKEGIHDYDSRANALDFGHDPVLAPARPGPPLPTGVHLDLPGRMQELAPDALKSGDERRTPGQCSIWPGRYAHRVRDRRALRRLGGSFAPVPLPQN
jgi:hypothetical protein